MTFTPEPEPQPAPSLADQPIATVPRVTFNYVVIAAVSLFVGLIVGFFAYERVAGTTAAAPAAVVDSQTIVDQAVNAALAALPTLLAPTVPPPVNVEVANNPFRGPEDAVITMIEFGDFRCGYCKRFNDETLASLMEQFDGKLRIVYRDYPVLGPESLTAALAAECADDQGKFWEFHDLVYGAQDQMTREAYIAHAQTLELDVETFTTCLDTEVHRAEVIEDYVAGQEAGVTGTPTFFINGEILIGAQPLDTFVLAIEAALSEAEATPEPA